MSFLLFFESFFEKKTYIFILTAGYILLNSQFYYMAILLLCVLFAHYYALKDPLFLLKTKHPYAKTYLTGKFLANKFIDKKIKNADIYVKNITGDELFNILKHYDIRHVFHNKETKKIERITIYYKNMYIEFTIDLLYGYSKITNMRYKINFLHNIYDSITLENIEYFYYYNNVLTNWMPHDKNFKFNHPLQILKIFKDVSFWNLNMENNYYDEITEFYKKYDCPNEKLNNKIMFDELYKFIDTSNSQLFIEKMEMCGEFEMLNNYYLNVPIKISNNLKEKLTNSPNNELKFIIFLIDVAEQNDMNLSEWIRLNNFNPSKIINKKYLKYACLFSLLKNEYGDIQTDYDFLIFLNKYYMDFYKLKKLSIVDILHILDVLNNNTFMTNEKINSILYDSHRYPLCENELLMSENDILHNTYNISYKKIHDYKKKALIKIYCKELQNEYHLLLKDFENEHEIKS